jgi:hypothetical protein
MPRHGERIVATIENSQRIAILGATGVYGPHLLPPLAAAG